MPISITNKPQLTGIIILFTGVALLAFTFINAFMFLQEPFGIIATGDLARVFGEALAPLIQACIRLMFLGIMGWIGSLLTIRGIPLVTHKYVPVAAPIVSPQAKPQPRPTPAPQKPISRPKQQPELKPKPTQTTQPQQALQQPKLDQQSSPPPPQQHTSKPDKEHPTAILIPPENQREE